MKKGNQFNSKQAIAEAQAGQLTGKALKKAIQRARDFNMNDVAEKLELYTVSSASFAGDAAPHDVRDRIAQGISALGARGHRLTRTRQMLKRHGVIETINRIARKTGKSKNFDALCSAGLKHLTAEAIVLDHPDLFDERTVAIADQRLASVKD